MVDVSQITDAATLVTTRRRSELTLQWLDAGGHITSFTVSPPPDAEIGGRDAAQGGGVNTEGWDYPQAMVTAIREHLLREIDEIDHKLDGMGVTGVSPQPRR